MLFPIPESEDLFRWVALHGLAVERVGGDPYARVDVPCSALEGNDCTIYPDRPEMCAAAGCLKEMT